MYMVYCDQSYLPISFLSPPPTLTDLSSPPDIHISPSTFLSFYKSFILCLLACVHVSESLCVGVVPTEARRGCWMPCCWTYRQLWAIQHGCRNWTPQNHPNTLNHFAISPAFFHVFPHPHWLSDFHQDIGAAHRSMGKSLHDPGCFTSSYTSEENVSSLINHHLMYKSSGSGEVPWTL